MKWLVDAQLPRRLSRWLTRAGHDALHTLELPEGNRTSDAVLAALSAQETRVLISKDEDFVASFMMHGQPRKLLLITTGNIRNTELESLFAINLSALVSAFATNDFVEMNRTQLIVHA